MNQTASRLYQHPGRPEWGRGLLVAERDKLLVIHWEDGKEHLVAATHRDRLSPVELPAAEQGAVVEKIREMQARSTAPVARARKSSRPARAAPPPMSFATQLQGFLNLYPEGFEGARYIAEERGTDGGSRPGSRQWAIARAAELLSPARFDEPAGLFDQVVAFLRPPLDLVHPMEGAIPLKGMKDEAVRAGFLAALRELLHGEGDYGPRFERFVASIQLAAKDGKVKRPGWPLVTLLPALHRPAERLFVKPQLMQKQAAIVGVRVNYQSAPSAATYEEFVAVARALEGRLRGEGHKPRDLLDVAAYVAATLGPGQTEAAAPAPEDD